MKEKKNDSAYIERVLTDARFVCSYMRDVSREDFEEDELLVSAMSFRLIQIHENAKMLSEEFRAAHPEIPWHAIGGLRNRIVHDYGEVDFHVLYETLTKDVPALEKVFSGLETT